MAPTWPRGFGSRTRRARGTPGTPTPPNPPPRPPRARGVLEASLFWGCPDQGSPLGPAGDARFNGVTPSGCVRNLVRRYTRPGDLVVGPLAGAGAAPQLA